MTRPARPARARAPTRSCRAQIGPRRIDPHGERVWNDCDAEYAPAGVGRFDRAATFSRPAREALVFAFPHHGAAPAQRAADVTGRNPDHLEPRHREMPAMPAHPESAVARRARYIVAACPVVSPVIDEAEPQPDGIVKIERHCRARCVGLAPNTVGRKCERPIRETAVLPTTELFRVAASRGRILRVKLGKHLAVNVGRQCFLEFGARQKNVMPLLDSRRRQKLLRNHYKNDQSESLLTRRADACGRCRKQR